MIIDIFHRKRNKSVETIVTISSISLKAVNENPVSAGSETYTVYLIV